MAAEPFLRHCMPVETDPPDVVDTLRWLASLAPTRLTGTADEQKVHLAIADRLASMGYRIDIQDFRFSRHIYGSLAMHFGLALVFAAVGLAHPAVAIAAHLVIAASFYSEAALRRHGLRALWPKVDTRNVLATKPCKEGKPRRRLVFLAHVDSAFTGFLFEPAVIRAVAAPPPRFLSFLQKQLLLPLLCVLGLAAFEAAHMFVSLPWWPVLILGAPPFLVFAFNAEVVVRNQPVPGAADNLTGCAAQIVLADAWSKIHSADTEVVFVFTGAEEAGTGGAAHLARTMRDVWKREETSVIVLDTLSNGELYMLEEGELFRGTIPADLAASTREAALLAGLPVPEPYVVPAGATDAMPFLVEGYRAMALTCVDPQQHTPRNYHHPNDTADRVDPVQLRDSVRLAEKLMMLLAAVEPSRATSQAYEPPESSAA